MERHILDKRAMTDIKGLEKIIDATMKRDKEDFLLKVHSMVVFHSYAVPFLKKLALMDELINSIPEYEQAFIKFVIYMTEQAEMTEGLSLEEVVNRIERGEES